MSSRNEAINGLPAMVFDLPKDRKPIDPASVTITNEPMTEEERAEWDALDSFLDLYAPLPKYDPKAGVKTTPVYSPVVYSGGFSSCKVRSE